MPSERLTPLRARFSGEPSTVSSEPFHKEPIPKMMYESFRSYADRLGLLTTDMRGDILLGLSNGSIKKVSLEQYPNMISFERNGVLIGFVHGRWNDDGSGWENFELYPDAKKGIDLEEYTGIKLSSHTLMNRNRATWITEEVTYHDKGYLRLRQSLTDIPDLPKRQLVYYP